MNDNLNKLTDALLAAIDKIEQALPGAFEAAIWRVQLSSAIWCGFWCLMAIIFCGISVACFRFRDIDKELVLPGIMFAIFSCVMIAIGGTELIDLFAPQIPAAKMLIEVVR